MKKRSLQIMITLLVAISILSASLSANAAIGNGIPIQPLWLGTIDIEAELSLTPLGRADCTGVVEVDDGYTADMTMELQRSTNLVTWETVNSWTASGGGTLELNKSYYVATGYYYQVKVSADVYNAYGTLIESPSKTSSIVY